LIKHLGLIMDECAEGLRKKLMVRLVITGKGKMPSLIWRLSGGAG
jgi:hypothetical protein